MMKTSKTQKQKQWILQLKKNEFYFSHNSIKIAYFCFTRRRFLFQILNFKLQLIQTSFIILCYKNSIYLYTLFKNIQVFLKKYFFYQKQKTIKMQKQKQIKVQLSQQSINMPNILITQQISNFLFYLNLIYTSLKQILCRLSNSIDLFLTFYSFGLINLFICNDSSTDSNIIIIKSLIKFMNTKQINQLIVPYQIHYDETHKRNYYFNIETEQSVWELPAYLQKRLKQYKKKLESTESTDQQKKNIYKYLPKQIVKKQKKKYLKYMEQYQSRPARKQVEVSLANNYSYKQGDEEFNFWYSKYINAKDQKDKAAALTKCNPQLDVGYTKSDLFQKNSTYFCLFFARGCCANGVNCRFFHRIPTMQDCVVIDNSKDIFGRARFSVYREDMKGVGSFAKQTRAIYVSDYKLPNNDNGVTQMYEILLRHFSMWAQIEDINILPNKGYAFIKFAHRCMAQFAKQCMQNQALDSNEILVIKWANEDPNPKVVQIQQKQQRRMLIRAMQQKNNEKQKQQKRKYIKDKRDTALKSMMKNYNQHKDQ